MDTERIGSREVIEQLPSALQELLARERFCLHKAEVFQDASRDPTFDRRYLPQNCDAFELPCFWVLRKHLYVYGEQTQKTSELRLFEGDGLSERVLFPIHPTSLSHYKSFLSTVDAVDVAKEGLRIWAVPTSSTRTVLAWVNGIPEKAMFVKMSLYSPLFGDRRLHRWRVGGSVGISNLVHDSLQSLPSALGYFPESVGVVPRSMQDGGVIFRSIPEEIKCGSCVVTPLFSLFGGSESHPPLFPAILEQSGMETGQFLEEVLCKSFVRLWLEMSMRFGLFIEAHGQDLMLALLPKMTPSGRFYYRDFEGLQVDWELRRHFGLHEPRNMPNAWSWREAYGTWGYSYGELAWWKLRSSLFGYLHFVLNELDLLLVEWSRRGIVRGPRFEKGDITMMFSRHMLQGIEDMFGVRAAEVYDIYRSVNRFTVFMMRLRRKLIAEASHMKREAVPAMDG